MSLERNNPSFTHMYSLCANFQCVWEPITFNVTDVLSKVTKELLLLLVLRNAQRAVQEPSNVNPNTLLVFNIPMISITKNNNTILSPPGDPSIRVTSSSCHIFKNHNHYTNLNNKLQMCDVHNYPPSKTILFLTPSSHAKCVHLSQLIFIRILVRRV